MWDFARAFMTMLKDLVPLTNTDKSLRKQKTFVMIKKVSAGGLGMILIST
jgi:hypothetical protein